MATFTADEVLAQLDACAAEFTFPMLDNGYVYPGDVRLSGYADEGRWALILEVVGFSPRGGLPNGISNALHHYGNCLEGEPGLANDDFLHVVAGDPTAPAFDAHRHREELLPGATVVRLRGEVVPVPSAATLAARGIKRRHRGRLCGEDLLRGLLPEHRGRLLATEAELRKRIPADLPLVIRLNEWHHPDVCGEERPGESETFRLVAEVLVRGDGNRYRPTRAPNTHWKNWPQGGTM
jgi:hypothetical protein